jgi:hypothetical protein
VDTEMFADDHVMTNVVVQKRAGRHQPIDIVLVDARILESEHGGFDMQLGWGCPD